MATLNFPDPSIQPTYTEAGITWTYNFTLGVWSSDSTSSGTGSDDTRYLRLDAASPAQTRLSTNEVTLNCDLTLKKNLTVDVLSTFTGLTTHKAGVSVTGGTLTGPSIFQIRTPGGSATGNRLSLNEENAGNPAFTLNAKAIASSSSNAICLSLNYNSATDQTQAASCLFTQFGQVATSTQNVYHNFASVNAQQNTSGDYIAYYTRINSDDNLGSGNAYGFFSGGTARNYFKGLTEHAGGVSVTGGYGNVSSGITGNTDNALYFFANDELRGAFKPGRGFVLSFAENLDKNHGSVITLGGLVSRTQDVVESIDKVCSISATPNFSGDVDLKVNGFSMYRASIKTGLVDVTNSESIAGYYAHQSIGSRGSQLNYGFLSYLTQSTLETTEGRTNYNFYALGDAPNYFAGLVESAGGVKVTGGFLQVSSYRTADNTASVRVNANISTTTNTQELKLFDAYPGGSGGQAKSLIGFRAASGLNNNGAEVYGFYSTIDGTFPNHYNFYAAGNAPNYFAGLVESAGGVKVTGGNSETLKISSNGTSNIILNDTNKASHNDSTSAGVAHNFQATRLDNAGTSAANIRALTNLNFQNRNRVVGIQSQTNNDIRSSQFDLFAAEVSTAQTLANSSVTGFRSNVNTDSNTGTNGTAHNFYAAGNAPSYFAGSFLIGNDDRAKIVSGTVNGICTDSSGVVNSSTIATTSDRNMHVFYNGTGGSVPVGAIVVNGNTTTYAETSDYRLKENVAPITDAIDRVKQLKPCKFNFITTPERTQDGFLAHEVQSVVSLATTGTKDGTEAIGTLADYDGTELETEVTEPEELEYTEEVDTDGVATMVTRTRSWTATGNRPVYQGVDQTKLIPLLTKALQEALVRIETLESEVSSLQNP